MCTVPCWRIPQLVQGFNWMAVVPGAQQCSSCRHPICQVGRCHRVLGQLCTDFLFLGRRRGVVPVKYLPKVAENRRYGLESVKSEWPTCRSPHLEWGLISYLLVFRRYKVTRVKQPNTNRAAAVTASPRRNGDNSISPLLAAVFPTSEIN